MGGEGAVSLSVAWTRRAAWPCPSKQRGWADQTFSADSKPRTASVARGCWCIIHWWKHEQTCYRAWHVLSSALSGPDWIMSSLYCFGLRMRHHRLQHLWGRSHQDRLYLSRFRKYTKGLSGRHSGAQSRMPARKSGRTMWVGVGANECRV